MNFERWLEENGVDVKKFIELAGSIKELQHQNPGDWIICAFKWIDGSKGNDFSFWKGKDEIWQKYCQSMSHSVDFGFTDEKWGSVRNHIWGDWTNSCDTNKRINLELCTIDGEILRKAKKGNG